MIQPNHTFLTYFPNVELPISAVRTKRSSCLRAGAFIVIWKIIKDCKLDEILGLYFNERDFELFLDLAAYTIIAGDNAGQYYPNYAYNHPLFTKDMKIYSNSTVFGMCKKIDSGKEIERSADMFASYFLMPDAALQEKAEYYAKKRADKQLELNDVIRVEQYFGVSHQAAVYRLMYTQYLNNEKGSS